MRSEEELRAALHELRNMPQELASAPPGTFPATPESLMARELTKVHDFCSLMLDEVLDMRSRSQA